MEDEQVKELVCYQCDPKGVNRKIVKVEQNEGDKIRYLECGHKSRMFFRTLSDRVTVSDSFFTSLIINPLPEIEQSLKNQDYFRAVAYLAAMLEYYGKVSIDATLRAQNRNIDSDRLDRFGLEEVAILLYSFDIIDQPCYSAVLRLSKLRNRLLHIKDMAEFRTTLGVEAETAVKKGMECIRVLMK